MPYGSRTMPNGHCSLDSLRKSAALPAIKGIKDDTKPEQHKNKKNQTGLTVTVYFDGQSMVSGFNSGIGPVARTSRTLWISNLKLIIEGNATTFERLPPNGDKRMPCAHPKA
jgi:hypothetical protein